MNAAGRRRRSPAAARRGPVGLCLELRGCAIAGEASVFRGPVAADDAE